MTGDGVKKAPQAQRKFTDEFRGGGVRVVLNEGKRVTAAVRKFGSDAVGGGELGRRRRGLTVVLSHIAIRSMSRASGPPRCEPNAIRDPPGADDCSARFLERLPFALATQQSMDCCFAHTKHGRCIFCGLVSRCG